MKMTFIEALKKYSDYFMTTGMLEFLASGKMKSYSLINGAETLIPSSVYIEAVANRTSHRLLMIFFVNPDLFYTRGHVPPYLKQGEDSISISVVYIKSDEVERDVIPAVFKPYQYIRPLKEDYSICTVMDQETKEWITEKYSDVGKEIVSVMMTTFRKNEAERIPLDRYAEQRDDGSKQNLVHIFRNKKILTYIKSIDRYLHFDLP